ncbi:zinc-ribbon domain-containing protein [Limimaricola sp.]|uniref:zinc-ribbon domain-containing protein n=1 Tax=Limimaricola sp. TaxID=2211665 RepID=UPI0025BC1759|nr:zinc-ribbon domain-containing protein [Limimaricola sp.]
MRLICPNCGAQYEVADDVIPASGRDVQCSSCGHTWFAQSGQAATEVEAAPPAVPPEDDIFDEDLSEEELAPPPAPDAPDAPDAPAEPAAPPPAAAQEDSTDSEDDVVAAIGRAMGGQSEESPPPKMPPDAAPPAQQQPPQQRKAIDPDVAQVLREEAAREAAQRQAEAATGLQTQDELGLPTADLNSRRADEARRRMARLRGEEAAGASSTTTTEEPPAPEPGGESARRNRLPDIEQINSTLRPTGEKNSTDTAATPSGNGGRGFRLGFSTVLMAAALLTLAYSTSDRIVAAVPAAAPVMRVYVSTVDQGRAWLDQQMMALTQRLGPSQPDGPGS